MGCFAGDALSRADFDARYNATDIAGSSLPAVSGFNFKIEAGYSHYTQDTGSNFAPVLNTNADVTELGASVTVPLGERFGLQIDGAWNDFQGQAAGGGIGGGAHLFWRDPAMALLGAYAHRIVYEDLSVTRGGVEVEAYGEALTFSGFAGVDHLDSPLGRENFVSAEGRISWYVTENLVVSAGATHTFGETRAIGGVESMLETGETAAASIYGEVVAGGGDTLLRAGVRVYFGNEAKSLKRRHREDDPASRLAGGFGAVDKCMGAIATSQLNQVFNLNKVPLVVSNTVNTNGLVQPFAPSLDGCSVQ